VQAILTGIFSQYSSDATLKATLPGGLHFEMAPQGTAMTYATFSLITARPDYMLAGEYFEVVLIQFDIYAATNALRQAAYDALTAVFDDARPAATGYSPLIMERANQQMVRDGEHNEIFRAIVEYRGTWGAA
jgi:hypothetical protein